MGETPTGPPSRARGDRRPHRWGLGPDLRPLARPWHSSPMSQAHVHTRTAGRRGTLLTLFAATLALASSALVTLACGGGDGGGVDASPDGGTMTSTRAGVGFLEPCTQTSECASGLCYRYNMATVGMRCTKTCSGDVDCPAPSAGCNNMGVCKHSGG
jgi:hypothetical protein